MSNKLNYFEYFVHKLYEEYGHGDENDLSILKLMKLLFFTTAINSKKDSDNILLNSAFNNFVAMPYGHVESTLYDSLRAGDPLKFYKVDKTKTVRKNNFNLLQFNESILKDQNSEIIKEIDNSFKLLSAKNSLLIKERVFNLVELSHQWYSWKKNYNEARESNMFSKQIPPNDIIKEDKFFSLQIF